MEKNIKEAISIIEDVRKSMPECTNKAFLKGALNELNEALRLHDVSGRSELLLAFGNFIASDTANLNYSPDEWVKMFLASNSH